MNIENILTRLFGAPEEVNGAGRCETYLYRWIVKRTKHGNIYIHHFVGEDWAIDLHDHPKDNLSIGVHGSYVDISERGSRIYKAPFVRFFQADYKHRIVARDCWTILFVGPHVKQWGFFRHGCWIPWNLYVSNKSYKSSCD